MSKVRIYIEEENFIDQGKQSMRRMPVNAKLATSVS